MTTNVSPPNPAIWVPIVGRREYQHILDMFERTGGTDDKISSLETGELYEQGISTPFDDEISFDESIHYPIEWVSVSTNSNVTANAFEFHAVTHKATINLPLYPDDCDVVTVLNVNGATVKVDGNGNLINGEKITVSNRKNTTINYHYFATLAAWYMR